MKGRVLLVFLHEFGGDARTWAKLVRDFGQQTDPPIRRIVLSARGYLPFDVPDSLASYS